MKNSRIGPIELENEEKCAGASPQLTPEVGWAIKKKKKNRPKKWPGSGSNPGRVRFPLLALFRSTAFFSRIFILLKKKFFLSEELFVLRNCGSCKEPESQCTNKVQKL